MIRYGIFVDWAANKRRHKVRLVLVALRITQLAMGDLKNPRLVSYPLVAAYRFLSEWVFGIELRPTTVIGSPLVIYHGFGLVVNPGAVIGDGVVLRNGVVIGNKVDGGALPRIGDAVEIGANAVILGGVSVGRGAVVGAGAIVLNDVPDGGVVAGNPARLIKVRDHE